MKKIIFNKKAFTLVELLITILIVGILASLVFPQYSKMVERSKAADARTMLWGIKTAEEMYFAKHDVYTNTIENLNISVPLDDDPNSDFIYHLWGEQIVAERKSGPYKNGQIIIFQDRADISYNQVYQAIFGE